MAPDFYSPKFVAAASFFQRYFAVLRHPYRRLATGLSLCVFSLFFAGSAQAQVVAGFTADDTAGCAPLIVNFTNSSTGATTYDWNLGNGTLSAFTNVTGTYPAAGTYTVTLTAHNGPVSNTYTSIIKVYGPPTVSFHASDTAVCPNSPITFTSTSTPGSWGSLTYNWVFGDGFTSTSSAPVHSYPTPGLYTVSQFATNVKGCMSSQTYTNYIHVLNPAAIAFNAPVTSFCKAPATVAFNNVTTGVIPITYKWDFGDGATSTVTSPNHTYTSSGSFTVRLIATDGKGCKDTAIYPNYITIGNLTASFTHVAVACGAYPVTFNNTSSTHISSQWFFGDGSTSASDVGVHAYTAAGTYNVKLVVFDGTCYDTVSHPISISYPTGSFNILPAHPCPPPSLLTFAGTVPTGCTVSWVFDDGSTLSGPTVTHTYSASRIYTTSMIVTDGLGCKDTVTKLDTLFNLNINPTPSPGQGCAPLINTYSVYAYSVVYDPFTLSSIFLTYPDSIASYSWNYGDGSPSGSGPTPSHTYTAAGSYPITCSISTTNGCTVNNTASVKVGTPQTAGFTCSPHRICAGKTISFHSTSTSLSLIDNYAWTYGDGASDYGGAPYVNTVHQFSVPGIYTVGLTVYYNGCVSPAFNVTDTVDSPGVDPHFTYDCIPANGIAFGDSSAGDNSHVWIFGDLTTSTLRNVNHIFPLLSTYNITLATYNSSSGCRDTAHFSLNLAKPYMSLYVLDTALCLGQADTILSTVIGRTVTKFNWYDNWSLVDTGHSSLIHSYGSPGLQNIELVIKDNFGCFDTAPLQHILVAKPADSFSFSPPAGCGPLSVIFADHSTDVTGAALTTYLWSFGDGTPPITGPAIATHTYTTPGTFSIQEIAFDNVGCSDTFSSAAHVVVHKPVATFSVTATTVCAGTGVHFVNTSTGITGSLWLFGDGTTSTINSPVHSYSSLGVYTVKLVVFDSYGCASDTLSMPGLVSVNFSPVAGFIMSDSFAVCAPLNVCFTNTSLGASSYFWIFGDGTTSVAPSPCDVYLTSALYHVQLVAMATNGCTDTATHSVSLFGYSGAFSYTPISGCSPLDVHFTATVSSVTSFFWDFADGSVFSGSTADTVSHVYHSAGNFLPKLLLTDTSGCQSFSYGADTIRVDTVSPHFSIIPSPACQYSAITFHDMSTSGSYFPMTSWLWSFGSGATSTVSTPMYTYSVTGIHVVTLSVTSAGGCTAVTTNSVTVNNAPPAISGPSLICQGAGIFFTDALSPGGWSSSNSSVASVNATSGLVTGVAAGTATITYTSGPGCPATKQVTVAPSPGAISGINAMCIGLTSPYTDTSTGGTWSIAPLTVASVSPTGIVTSIAAGVATLSYTMGSCSATKSITVTPAPSNISGPLSVCVGITVPFSDSIPGGTWTASNAHISIGSASGAVTGVSSGISVITYSLGAGCTKTKNVTVNPLSPILGPTGVCVGGVISLTDSLGGGTWSSSATALATVGSSSGNVTGMSAGSLTIYYTLPTGCIASHPVTVHGLPSPIGGNLHVCQYATDTLSDTASGGTWSIAPVTIGTIDPLSGVLTGLLTGTATVTYSLGSTGCQKIATITVNPAPAAISGFARVCPGSTITLTDGTSPGVWSCSSTLATIGSSSGIVSGITTGIATVTYTASSTGCSRTQDVTVNPVPSPISGPSTICIGQSAPYTDTLTGATWSTSPAAIATVGSASGVVTGLSPGVLTLSCPILVTGYTCPVTKTITVNSTPATITGPGTVCVGATATLSDLTPSGFWVPSTGSIIHVATTGIVTGLMPGIDSVTYSIGIGCNAVHVMTVTALPPAITGPDHVCVNASIALTDATAGGAWSSSNPFVAMVDSTGLVTGVSAGAAYITYSLGSGCVTAKLITVNPSPGGIYGNSYVCLGGTTTLSDLTPGGSWSSSSPYYATVSGSGVVYGAHGGAGVISYTGSNSCSATKTMTVIAVPPISGLMPSCAWYDTLAISDSALGGIFTSYSVIVNNLGGGTAALYTHAPGVAVVSYILPSGCATSATMTVNPLPDNIMGGNHVCVGHTAALTDVSGGGIWTSPGYSSIATVGSSTGIVSGISSGTAMVTYTLPLTGCHVDTTIFVGPQPTAISGPSAICAGATGSVTDSVTGGLWSSSNPSILAVGSVSGTITGVSAGVATITYTLDLWCTVVRTITVNPLPAAFTTVGGGAYCFGSPGAHVYLGGSQSGVRYQLFNGTTPVDTSLPGTGFSMDFGYQPGAGTYTVSAFNNATGCSAAMPGSAVITINPAPNAFPMTGGGSYCAGGTGTHIGLAGSVTGTTYRLYRGTTPVGLLTAGTGSALDFGLFTTVGNYKVLATLLSTTCTGYMSDSVSVSITPNVTPAVQISLSPGDTVCAGTVVNFTATSVNGGTSPAYQWHVNGSGGATGVVYSYAPANNDAVSVELTSNAPCPLPDTATASVTLDVTPLVIPAVSITAIPGLVVTPGKNDTLIAVYSSGGPAPTFQWYKNGSLIPGATSDTLMLNNITTTDAYSCIVTSSGTCGGQQGNNAATITVNSVGTILIGSSAGIVVVPNPNNGAFTIKGATGSGIDEDMQASLTDLLGQEVYQCRFVAHGGELNQIVQTGKALPNGVYLLSLRSVTGTRVFHIVIEQ